MTTEHAPKIDYSQTVTTPEGLDGEVYAVEMDDDTWRIIWRDDDQATADAARFGAHPEDRWYDSRCEDGMGWAAHLRYAVAVWPLLTQSRIPLTREPVPSAVSPEATDGHA